MIKTEAVTVKAPPVAMSYEDILDMNLSVLMDGMFDASSSFKKADPNSIKGKIWKKNPMLMSPHKNFFFLEQLYSTTAVYIGYAKPLNIGKYMTYSRLKQLDLKAMLSKDHSEEYIVRVSAFNSFLDPK